MKWLAVACIEDWRIFRCVTHSGTVWGSGISEKVVRWGVRHAAEKAAIEKAAPHDPRVAVLGSAIQPVENLTRFSSYWDIDP
jgi:hypothetical protein